MVALPVIQAARSPAGGDAPFSAGPRNIRAVHTLRISVTDRCNFRCVYCMPHDAIDWLPRDELLTFEEIAAVARVAISHGIRDFKLTGGEPLVRRDLPALIARLRALPGIGELSMTTNGVLLAEQAPALRVAGIDRLTVSMDSLDPRRFHNITRGGDLRRVWAGIDAARAAGFPFPKINCVVMRGINDDELVRFAALTLETGVTVRFIEFMPLAESELKDRFGPRFVSEAEMRAALAPLGRLDPAFGDSGCGPAITWRIRGAVGRIGFISAMSKPFCDTCNRLRLTSTGQLRSCLFEGGEVELRPLLRPRKLRGALRKAFVRCAAFKPGVHGAYGNRQMSQIGG